MTKIATPDLVNAIDASGLGKKYHSFWALKNCDITIPAGAIVALVGPNGAGKTTLLKLLAGLNRPSVGEVTALGLAPGQTTEYLSNISYLAQQIPLYGQMTAVDHLAIGRHTEAYWDNDLALRRLTELKIPLDRPVEKLSGGQRAQVGLAMTLAKKPKLLLLDEPVAALDPLARAEFLASLTQAVADAEGELTVVMSSHLLSDLERVCDHVIILASGQTQICSSVEQVVESHKLLVGPPNQPLPQGDYTIVQEARSSATSHIIVRLNDQQPTIPGWHVRDVDIEEVVLAYMKQARTNQGQGGAQ